MFNFPVAGITAPIPLLVLIGFTVGIVGGFIGVGGGYMVTPALIVFGFPGYMASGIDMTHIAAKGVVSTIRHRQLGNIDWTMALSMVAGTMLGVEIGVRLLVFFKHLGLSTIVLLITSVAVMFSLFLYTQIETRRAHKKIEEMTRKGENVSREVQTSSLPRLFQNIPLAPIVICRTARVVVSMWVVVLVGLITGILAGFLGVGGGFIRVPALVYIVGASTHIAVGTDLVEIVFSGGYGALRHSIEGHVDMMAVVFMLAGAMFGAQIGSIATSFVRGPAIRYILSYSLILATCGAVLRLAYVLTGQSIDLLSLLAVMLTLGEMIFLCLFIMSLVFFAVLYQRGRKVPDWVPPLVATRPTSARLGSTSARLDSVMT